MTYSWQEVFQLRAKLYTFLGSCLHDPIDMGNEQALSPKLWKNFPLEVANEHMKAGLEKLIQCIDDLHKEPLVDAFEKVNIEYTELFLGPSKPLAPPWESVYRTDEKVLFGWPTFQVRKIMSRHGFEIKTQNKEPEDHIGTELLFLAAISEKLVGDVDSVSSNLSIVKEQIEFIDEHLLSWIPMLCKDAKENGSVGFYGGLIELTWGILLWDKEVLKEYIEEIEKR